MDGEALHRWLKKRLTEGTARADWRRLLEAGFEGIFERPLSEVLPAADVEALVKAHLDAGRAADLVRPLIRGGLHEVLLEAKADNRPIGRWVPPEASKAIDDLVAKKGLIQEAWIKQVFSEKAVEVLVSDTLSKVLIDFSTLIPRLVQSLMPSALGRLSKLGGGVGGRMVEEIERLLESEVKKFMGRGTRMALDGAARFAVDHIDDPVSVGTRQSLVRFTLNQSGAFHAQPITPELEAELERIFLAIASEVVKREESAAIAARVIERIKAAHGDKSVRAYLSALGVDERPPYDEWANLTWPGVLAVLSAPGVDAWLRGLTDEIAAEMGRGQ